MSKVQVDTIVDKDDISAPTLSKGAIVTGVCTATTFVGAVTGNVTGNADTATTATTATNAQGLTGSPSITVTDVGANDVNATGVGTFGSVVSSGAISGTTGTFTGDANITGVTTTGIGTVTTSVVVGSAVTANSDGVITSGIVTAAGGLRCNDGAAAGVKIGDGEDLIIQHNGTDSFIDNNTGDLYVQTTGSGDDVFVQPADALYLQSGGANTRLLVNGVGSFTFDNGTFIEKCKITAGKLSDNQDIDLLDGMVHYFTTQESTTAVPNLRESASRTLGDAANTGDIITVNIITTAAAAGYSAQLTIDGNAVTEEWIGGSAPSAGSSDGLDIYVYSCIRIGSGTGDSGWKVIANVTNATN